jgi:hypothetical protein
MRDGLAVFGITLGRLKEERGAILRAKQLPGMTVGAGANRVMAWEIAAQQRGCANQCGETAEKALRQAHEAP